MVALPTPAVRAMRSMDSSARGTPSSRSCITPSMMARSTASLRGRPRAGTSWPRAGPSWWGPVSARLTSLRPFRGLGGRGAGARRLRPVPRLSSAVRRGAGGGGRARAGTSGRRAGPSWWGRGSAGPPWRRPFRGRGGRGAGARRLRPVPRLSSAVRRGAGGGGRGTVVGGPDRPGSPVRGGRSSGQVEDHGPTRAGRAPPVPGRSCTAGPPAGRGPPALAVRAPPAWQVVHPGPLGSWPVLSARGRSARGGSRSGRLGSFVRRGHQLLVVGVAPGGGGAAGQEQGGDDGAEDGDAR